MRVLVTGGAGFIGSHVVAALRDAGHDVTALDMLHPAAHRDRHMPDGVLLGDVRDPAVVAAVVRNCDVVVHQAAMVGMGVDLHDLPEYVSCNDLGTAVLLAAMASAGVERLVLASSMVVYGEGAYRCARHGPVAVLSRDPADLAAGRFDPVCPHCGQPVSGDLVDEDAALSPRSVYAATKLAQEHLAAAWARESGGACISLRYHNVYGPGMPRDTPYCRGGGHLPIHTGAWRGATRIRGWRAVARLRSRQRRRPGQRRGRHRTRRDQRLRRKAGRIQRRLR